MKNFSQFIKEEVSIKGNEGIPGQGSDKTEKDYLNSVEQRARARVGADRDEDPRRGAPRQTMQTGEEMMGLMNQSMRLMAGKEKELEELAKDIILSEYGTILDNVDLDIQIIKPGKVKEFMDEESESEPEEMPSMQLLNDPEIKKEVDKRKIINNITQGEAKNTKRILALPEVKDRLIDIFGERNGAEIHRLWSRITVLADKMDWLIPVDIKGDMMERKPQGIAGAVSVKWPGIEEADEDLADKVLNNMDEEGDISEDEDIQELLSTGNPVIKARGIDFPMLLHETVKGIYELIAAAGIPADKRTAELVMLNTSSFEDEAEEFRFGPELAADMRDFINKSTAEIDKYPNIREHFYGRLHSLPVNDFLLLVKGILLETSKARQEVDKMINEIIEELDSYELDQALPSGSKNNYSEEDHSDTKEVSNDDEDSFMDQMNKKAIEKESDYENMTQREIQDLIDNALDNNDFDTVKKLSSYLKEGREIYLKEIEKINESRKYNSRTK